MGSPFDRVVTKPFSASSAWATYRFQVGDIVEFMGQMPEEVPGMALIATDRGIGLWVNAKELKANTEWKSKLKIAPQPEPETIPLSCAETAESLSPD